MSPDAPREVIEPRVNTTVTDQARKTTDGPWCWQSKAALDRISAGCDSRPDKASVLAVYLALTWKASNKQKDSFECEKQELAATSGVGYRKVADTLKLLCELGVITSTPNFLEGTDAQGANTYTLCTICTPPVHGTKNASVPRLLEESEESEKSKRKTLSSLAATAPAQWTPSLSLISEIKAEAEANGHADDFGKWYEINERKGWQQVNKTTGKLEPIKNLRASFAGFSKHISVENQCSREKSNRRRTGQMTEADYAKGVF